MNGGCLSINVPASKTFKCISVEESNLANTYLACWVGLDSVWVGVWFNCVGGIVWLVWFMLALENVMWFGLFAMDVVGWFGIIVLVGCDVATGHFWLVSLSFIINTLVGGEGVIVIVSFNYIIFGHG